MSDELLRRLAERINPQDPDGTSALLRTSPTFQADLGWLERLFAVADAQPLPPVPESLSASLLRIAERDSDEVELFAQLERAVLIHDSRSDTELVGVRGAASTAEAWTAIYSTPAADLIIDGTPEGPGRTAISGHVLNRAGEQFVVRITEPVSDRVVSTDTAGIFDLGTFEAGQYKLRVEGGGLGFLWELTLP